MKHQHRGAAMRCALCIDYLSTYAASTYTAQLLEVYVYALIRTMAHTLVSLDLTTTTSWRDL